jgi:hypothetical protein
MILVLFLYVEGFSYGEFIREYCRSHGCDGQGKVEGTESSKLLAPGLGKKEAAKLRPSGDDPNGFVVYRQTVELVEMLNREALTSIVR